MKRIKTLLLIAFTSTLSILAQSSFSFDCIYHEKGMSKTARATIAIDEISNGVRRGKCLKVEAYTYDNPSKKVFLTYTDPTNGQVFCQSLTTPIPDKSFAYLEYRWLFTFQTNYSQDSFDAFEIGVQKIENMTLNKFGIIRIGDYYNAKSRGNWLTLDYDAGTWLGIVKIITEFKETHAYKRWTTD